MNPLEPADNPRIDVHAIRLNAPEGLIGCLQGLLRDEERSRAASFRFPEHATQFIQAHAAVRILLAEYLEADPRELAFVKSATGKPSLQNAAGLAFNLSHSGRLACMAAGCDCRLGVDVEQMRGLSDRDAIVEGQFSAREKEEYSQIEPAFREQAFYSVWTRKEAYVKARGEGLRIPLESFSVPVRSKSTSCLRDKAPEGAGSGLWQIQSLDLEPGYAGGLAYSGEPRMVVVFQTAGMGDVWAKWQKRSGHDPATRR